MKSQGLNSLLPRITLCLPLIGGSLRRSSVRETSSSLLPSVLASCGFSLYQLPVSATSTAAKAYFSLPRNRAFLSLPLTPFSVFTVRESILPLITLGWAGAV